MARSSTSVPGETMRQFLEVLTAGDLNLSLFKLTIETQNIFVLSIFKLFLVLVRCLLFESGLTQIHKTEDGRTDRQTIKTRNAA